MCVVVLMCQKLLILYLTHYYLINYIILTKINIYFGGLGVTYQTYFSMCASIMSGGEGGGGSPATLQMCICFAWPFDSLCILCAMN